MGLLPITRELAAELAARTQSTGPTVVEELTPGTTALAIEISLSTPVAFVTTCYFGGDGGQDALVWQRGALIFSPSSSPYADSWPNSPISRALRLLGVAAVVGKDEFDTIGLGNYRSTEKWAAHARVKTA